MYNKLPRRFIVLRLHIVNGNRNYFGTYHYVNGDKYVGEWKGGKMHGQGTYYFSNGSKYVGEWYNDLITIKDNKKDIKSQINIYHINAKDLSICGIGVNDSLIVAGNPFTNNSVLDLINKHDKDKKSYINLYCHGNKDGNDMKIKPCSIDDFILRNKKLPGNVVLQICSCQGGGLYDLLLDHAWQNVMKGIIEQHNSLRKLSIKVASNENDVSMIIYNDQNTPVQEQLSGDKAGLYKLDSFEFYKNEYGGVDFQCKKGKQLLKFEKPIPTNKRSGIELNESELR